MGGDSNPERAGLGFIRVELELALTLLQLAATENGIGDRAGSEKALALAREAYSNFERFWPTVEKQATEAERGKIMKLQKEVADLISPR